MTRSDTPPSRTTLDDDLDFVERTLREAFERRRRVLAEGIVERLRHLVQPAQAPRTRAGDDWIRIESLSQLRSLVGGRFANLKTRWLNAGFPLREHRGDRKDNAEINAEGWDELARWIFEQGFEIRRSEAGAPQLFDVRSRTGDRSAP